MPKKLNPEIMEELGIVPEDFEPKKVSDEERALAQALYTAIMTDTLLDEEGEGDA